MTKPINTFKSFYQSLPGNEKPNFKDEIMAIASISQDTFYRRLKNPELFSYAEKKAIAEKFNVTVYTLFGIKKRLIAL